MTKLVAKTYNYVHTRAMTYGHVGYSKLSTEFGYWDFQIINGIINRATIFKILIIGLIAGPAVSL